MLVRGVKTTTTNFPEEEEPDVESEHVNFLVKIKLDREKESSINSSVLFKNIDLAGSAGR